MNTLILFFLGTFWEASMDLLSQKHNYEQSRWKQLANYFDRINKPRFGNQFWDNSVAWANKYKNKDPKQGPAFFGSTTFLVMLVDGWHVVKLMWLIHLFLAIVFYNPITPYLALDALILFIVFGLGHELFLYLLKLKPAKEQV